MDNTSVTKSARLPTFSGQREEFQMWWIRFVAHAEMCGFLTALEIGGETTMPDSSTEVLDLTTDDGKLAAASKQRNAMAMANLTMAFDSESLFGMIYKSMSKEYRAGKAHLVVKELFNKYNPEDVVSRVELRKMLAGVSMKDTQDPSTLFEQVSAIRNRYDTAEHQVDEEELIAVIMERAPEKYTTCITTTAITHAKNLTLTHLEQVMYQLWRQSKDSNRSIPEISLSGFEGYCYHCKKQGHKADACPSRPKPIASGGRTSNSAGRGGTGGRGAGRGGTARFQGACRNCGKQGHMERNCWQKEENAGLRPAGYKAPSENANSAIEKKTTSNYECLLCSLTFPNKSNLLLDPNVWIADTGASVHMTSHRQGFINERKASDSAHITMGNGAIETASIVGTLPGTVCDQYGNLLMRTAITDVTYLPNATYNLFSLTQMMAKGWC